MDTAIATPVEAAPAKAADGLIEVRVTAIRYAARDTHLYELTRLDGEPLPPYAPGAHIDLHLPNGLVRQYSLIEAESELTRGRLRRIVWTNFRRREIGLIQVGPRL